MAIKWGEMHSGKCCHLGAEELLDAACHCVSNVCSALPHSSPFPESFPDESTPPTPPFPTLLFTLSQFSTYIFHSSFFKDGCSLGTVFSAMHALPTTLLRAFWKNVMFRKGVRKVQHLATMQENFLWIIPFITAIKYTTILIAFGSKKEPIKNTFPTGPHILNY